MSRHTDRSRSSAARQRRPHRRVVNGRVVISVEIDDTAVPLALISAGYLSPDAVDDRKAIGRAGRNLISINAHAFFSDSNSA